MPFLRNIKRILFSPRTLDTGNAFPTMIRIAPGGITPAGKMDIRINQRPGLVARDAPVTFFDDGTAEFQRGINLVDVPAGYPVAYFGRDNQPYSLDAMRTLQDVERYVPGKRLVYLRNALAPAALAAPLLVAGTVVNELTDED